MKKSTFKNNAEGRSFLLDWNAALIKLNQRNLQMLEVDTSFGKTCIHALNHGRTDTEKLVIFPGARTCGMFWDLDAALDELIHFSVYLVEVNGQPSLSEMYCPSMKNDDYGKWGAEILNALSIDRCNLAGASLGGIIAMRTSILAKNKVKKIILLNPAGLQPFSMKWKNLWYNILPILSPTIKNIRKFAEYAVFHPDTHVLKGEKEKLFYEYMLYVLQQFHFKGEYPAQMKSEELKKVTSDCYLLLGDQDSLFPYEKSKKAAETYLSSLKEVKIFEGVAHGIETYRPAIRHLAEIILKN